MEKVAGEIEIPDAVVEWLEGNLKVKKGKLVWRTHGREAVYTNVVQKLLADRQLVLTLAQFEEYSNLTVAANKPAPVKFEAFETERHFVTHHWDRMGIRIDEKGRWTHGQGEERLVFTQSHFLDVMREQVHVYNSSIPIGEDGPFARPLSTKSEVFNSIVSSLVRERREERVIVTRESIAYDATAAKDTDVNGWCAHLMGIYGFSLTPENIEVFKHLLWSIKRNIWIRDIETPLFFSFHSRKQGIGKSRFVQHLADPFSWAFNPNGDLFSLLEVNNLKAMVRDKVLVDFQELGLGARHAKGSMDEAVMAKLKQVLTTDVITGRQMYGHESTGERQGATFVSSTNLHIYDVLGDDTGMRRYWEFSMKPAISAPYKKALIDGMWDYLPNIYRAIDESNGKGYYHDDAELWPAMRAVQEAYATNVDLVSKFLELRGIELTQGDAHSDLEKFGWEKMTVTRFHDLFSRWLKERNEDDRFWKPRMVLSNLASRREVIAFRDADPKKGTLEEYLWVKRGVK